MKTPGAIEIQSLASIVIFHNLSLVELPLTMLSSGNQVASIFALLEKHVLGAL